MKWVIFCCRELAKDFVVSGTASESLYGACESMYKPNMVSCCVVIRAYIVSILAGSYYFGSTSW